MWRVYFPEREMHSAVRHLSGSLAEAVSSLPPGNGRAALKCRYTWPCNP